MMLPSTSTKYTVAVFGKIGTGKSSLLNKLCGVPTFTEGENIFSETKEIKAIKGTFFNQPSSENCLFIDTPGLYDPSMSDEAAIMQFIEFMRTIKDGINLILFCFPIEIRFDNSYSSCLKILGNMLGNEVFKLVRLVITFQNITNPAKYKEQITKLKAQLPGLMSELGIPLNSKEIFEYYHDASNGNLSSVVTKIKEIEKYKPPILNNVAALQGKSNIEVLQNLMEKHESIKNMVKGKELEAKIKAVKDDIEKSAREAERLRIESEKMKKQQEELKSKMTIHSEEIKKMTEHWCTYHIHGKNYVAQEYYQCLTCWGADSTLGCCVGCSTHCHNGHSLKKCYSPQFYCDCGVYGHISRCTRASTGTLCIPQPLYICCTCFENITIGGVTTAICEVCSKKCHAGHQLATVTGASSYCHCGLNGCKAYCLCP